MKRLYLILLSILFLASSAFGAGEFVNLNLKSSTTDSRGELTSYTISRGSAATYIDPSGVMQTADGDTASTQASLDNETGATGIKGSFVDDQAWFEDDNSILSAFAGTADLLIADDGTYQAYGYIGAAGSGESKTALSNNVTGITKADPGVVSSTAHGLAVGDQVYFSGLTEMTELNTKYITVTAVGDANNFSINNTSGYGSAETTGGAVCSEVTEPASSAVHIYKEPNLTNEGWAVIESGFDYNGTFTFDVYGSVPTTGAGAEQRIEAKGLLNEGGGTNWCLQSRNMTQAVWTATNITTAKDVTGLDNSANSASRLTASLANGTILQTLPTMASATHIYSVWLKRITGTGSVFLTDDNGSNWTEKTLTTSWQRFSITRSQTAPVVGIKIATSGDVIGVDANQFEQSQAYMTSFIPTTTIPSARMPDTNQSWTQSTAFKNLMGDTADSPFTMVAEFTLKFDYGDTSANGMILSVDSVTGKALFLHQSGSGLFITDDGPNQSIVDPNYTANTTYLYALRVYDNSGMKFEVGYSDDSGATWTWDATPADYDGSFNPTANFIIGYDNPYPFNLGFVKFYDSAKSQAWIEAGSYNVSGAALLMGIF